MREIRGAENRKDHSSTESIQGILFLLLLLAIMSSILPGCTSVANPDVHGSPGDLHPNPGFITLNPPEDIQVLSLDGDILIAGGIDGVYAIDTFSHRVTSNPFNCPESMRFVRSFSRDRTTGNLWIGYDEGVSIANGTRCDLYSEPAGFPRQRANWITQDPAGTMWIGTWQDAYYVKNGGLQRLSPSGGLLDPMVNRILADRNGGIWFGSGVAPRGGISLMNNGTWQYFTIENGLPHNNINAFLEDSDGSVWATTGLLETGGAIRFSQTGPGGSWTISTTLNSTDGLPEGKINSIFRDRDGILWIGSENNGVSRLAGGRSTIFTEHEGLAQNEVKSMVQDRYGTLWFATRNGISKLNASALEALHRK